MEPSQEREAAPIVLTDAQRRSILRRCLASALRAGGYEDVAAGEVPTSQPSSDGLGLAVFLVAIWGPALAVPDLAGWGAWTLLPFFVLVTVVVALALRSGASTAGSLLLLAWFGTLAAQLFDGGNWAFTHAVPAGGLVLLRVVQRQIDVRSVRDIAVAVAAIPRAAPLVAPLVLVVLVLPSLSEDVWKVADGLTVTRLAVLSALTIGLLFLLVVRELRRELPRVLSGRASALVAQPKRADETRAALRNRLRPATVAVIDAEADDFVDGAWPTDGAQYGPFLAATAGRRLTAPLSARLAVFVGFLAVSIAIYLYAIVATVIRPGVVTEWTEKHVPTHEVSVLFLQLTLPAGPYLAVTGLLTCLAVATFLAFSLIEERFAVALGDALLRVPTDALLALALPFLELTEEWIIEGDSLPDDFDVETFGENKPSDSDQR
ncbi:MAG: hypothetical protein WKF96_08565 [Solirubrobacteraceae bacterium]